MPVAKQDFSTGCCPTVVMVPEARDKPAPTVVIAARATPFIWCAVVALMVGAVTVPVNVGDARGALLVSDG